MASITMTLEEYQALQQARETALKDASDLKAELVLAKQADPSNTIVPLTEFSRAALDIVRFAVANLPPETIKGWPTGTLRKVTERMATLPDYNVDDRELATELNAFAAEADRYERNRRAAMLPPVVVDGTLPHDASV